MHTTFPVMMPVAAPFEARSAHGALAASAPTTQWRKPVQRSLPPEQLVGTQRMKRSDRHVGVGKVVLAMVLLVIAGFFLGGYVVLRTEAGTPRDVAGSPALLAAALPAPSAPVVPVGPRPTPALTAEAVPAAKPVLAAAAAAAAATSLRAEPPAPADTAARAAMLVDVRIDSAPSGAMVTLVDGGKSQLVGKTPVTAGFDPAREYDLVFTFPGKATQLAHLNAGTTRLVAVTLDVPASAAAPADHAPPHVEKPADHARRHVDKPADRAPRHVEKAPATPRKRVASEPVQQPAAPAIEPVLGDGTLMVSSKPPCEIVIDGKPTGLTTPQRSITLTAGNHRITLVNSEKDIKKTISVQITANTTEKVIEDLMP
jgi:hypothetical protein